MSKTSLVSSHRCNTLLSTVELAQCICSHSYNFGLTHRCINSDLDKCDGIGKYVYTEVEWIAKYTLSYVAKNKKNNCDVYIIVHCMKRSKS